MRYYGRGRAFVMATTQTSNRPPLVLAVDDVPENLQVLGNLLQKENVEIAMASNGADALAIAAADPPSLILLDIMMPGMDGYEVCRRLKQDITLSLVPVIFLTARADTEDVVKGFEAGCVDYVTKPFREAELRARVRTQLQLHQLRSLLPICMYCHDIRDEEGHWERVDAHLTKRTGVTFSHGLCPDCLKKHFPDV